MNNQTKVKEGQVRHAHFVSRVKMGSNDTINGHLGPHNYDSRPSAFATSFVPGVKVHTDRHCRTRLDMEKFTNNNNSKSDKCVKNGCYEACTGVNVIDNDNITLRDEIYKDDVGQFVVKEIYYENGSCKEEVIAERGTVLDDNSDTITQSIKVTDNNQILEINSKSMGYEKVNAINACISDIITVKHESDNVFKYTPRQSTLSVGFQAQNYGDGKYGPPGERIDTRDPQQYFASVSRIINSNTPNYKGCRVQIHSELNIPYWEEMLRDYIDKDLTELLKYGFPLGIANRNALDTKAVINHNTATQYEGFVEKYLEKEINKEAILGPFQSVPHTEFHCSPLSTRAKDDDNRRRLVNLSHGDDTSVNGNTLKNIYEDAIFTLTLPTIDNLLNDVLKCANPRLYKIDISRAF